MNKILNLSLGMTLAIASLSACETAPKAPPKTAVEVKPAYDAVAFAKAVRRVDALRLQQRQDEIATPCQGKTGDPICDFMVIYAQDDRNAAWKAYDLRVKRDPKDALALVGMQLIYIEWKIEDQAEANYQRAVAIDPTLAIAHSRMGLAYLRKGDEDRARGFFAQALKVDADDADALLGQARLEKNAGEDDKALTTFDHCLKVWPENPEPAEEAAKLALKQGNADQAASYFREATQRAPHAVNLRRELAALLARNNKPDQAMEVYKEVVALDPKNFASLLALAQLATQAGDDDAAFAFYRQAGDANEEDLDVQRALGRGYLKREQPSGAETAYQQVLKLAPDDAEAHKALARINVKAKRYAEAVGHFRAALAKQADPELDKERLALEEMLHIPSKAIQGGSVNRVFNKALSHILKLYKERLKQRPKLAGQVTLKVSIDPQGAVKDFIVTEDTVKDALLLACIEWNIRDAHFPKSGKTQHFTYPITFDH